MLRVCRVLPTRQSPRGRHELMPLTLARQQSPRSANTRWDRVQEVLHLHRLSDKLKELRELGDAFLNQYANGSLELLHYVGLLPKLATSGLNC